MKEVLIQFLSQFEELTKNEIEELAMLLKVKEIKKNTFIVKKGQFSNYCYFVLKGCLRQYIVDGEIEKTIAIYTEEQAVNYFTSQAEKKASDNYLISIEDSVLLIGNPETDGNLYAKFPVLAEITRHMVELELGKAQNTLAKFITSTPEERYLNLFNERPELFQRVPLNIIASYIGMTPESLSRIRKRIHTKI